MEQKRCSQPNGTSTYVLRISRYILTKQFEKDPKMGYTIRLEDLLSLFVVLSGKDSSESHVERVRKTFPGLMD
jgi:hypothetical protein